MIENLENYEDAVPVKTVFEYTFDGEKPATRTETDLANNTKTTVKYNDGRVYDYYMEHLDSAVRKNKCTSTATAENTLQWFFMMILCQAKDILPTL